jgi:hypothetical protein
VSLEYHSVAVAKTADQAMLAGFEGRCVQKLIVLAPLPHQVDAAVAAHQMAHFVERIGVLEANHLIGPLVELTVQDHEAGHVKAAACVELDKVLAGSVAIEIEFRREHYSHAVIREVSSLPQR